MTLPGSKTEERHIGQDGNEQGIVTEGGGQVEVQQAVDSALQAATWTLQARQDMERAAGEKRNSFGAAHKEDNGRHGHSRPHRPHRKPAGRRNRARRGTGTDFHNNGAGHDAT